MVEHARIEALVADLHQIAGPRAPHPEHLAQALQKLTVDLQTLGCETIQTILDGVFASLPSLARELGKEAPRLRVSDHGIVLRQQIADPLRDIFMHLYRNALDHGIEPAAERVAAGKPPYGTVALELMLTGEQLTLRLEDDGRGLALGHIRRRAAERRLLAEPAAASDEALAELIFAAGFSTASAVSEVSGRGVGMDAVRNFVKREGGEIRIAFTDDNVGDGFRAFATVIVLPARYAVGSAAASASAVRAAGHGHQEIADELRAIVGGLVRPAPAVVV